MKNKNQLKLFVFFAAFVLTISGYAQKIEVPIKWKVGDTWTYELKQRNLGGVTGSDKYAEKSFQLKVLAIAPEGTPGYTVEWQYLSYHTFATDTIESDCDITFKDFLLKTPFRLRLNEAGELINRVGKAELKKQLLAFYTAQSKKAQDTQCLDNLKSMLNLAGDDEDYLETFTPEIDNFFLASSLRTADINYRRDTYEVFNDYIFDAKKIIRLPKVVSVKASDTFANTVEVDFLKQVSEKDYKKYFDESTRAAWDKLGLEKNDEIRKGLEEQLEVFQPKNSEARHIIFNKNNGSIVQFDYIIESWGMLKGGESVFYYYKKK